MNKLKKSVLFFALISILATHVNAVNFNTLLRIGATNDQITELMKLDGLLRELGMHPDEATNQNHSPNGFGITTEAVMLMCPTAKEEAMPELIEKGLVDVGGNEHAAIIKEICDRYLGIEMSKCNMAEKQIKELITDIFRANKTFGHKILKRGINLDKFYELYELCFDQKGNAVDYDLTQACEEVIAIQELITLYSYFG